LDQESRLSSTSTFCFQDDKQDKSPFLFQDLDQEAIVGRLFAFKMINFFAFKLIDFLLSRRQTRQASTFCFQDDKQDKLQDKYIDFLLSRQSTFAF
jgi:hypothetical protein